MTATLHSVGRHVAPVWKMIHSAQLIMGWKDVHVQEVKLVRLRTSAQLWIARKKQIYPPAAFIDSENISKFSKQPVLVRRKE